MGRPSACLGRKGSGHIIRSRGTLPDDSAVKKEAGNSPPNEDEARLDGWEEIASFLGRGIRTVRRWEKDAALPVRRLFKQRRSLVHAYRKELAHWVKEQEEHPSLPLYLTSESQPDGDPNVSAPRDVLAGWKEIAVFLGRSVRTVQRREKAIGLPVRRLKSTGRSIAYALRSELAAWLKEQGIRAASTGEGGLGLRPLHLLQDNNRRLERMYCRSERNMASLSPSTRHGKKESRDMPLVTRTVGWAKTTWTCANHFPRRKPARPQPPREGITELLRGERQSLQIRYRANTST